MGNSDDQHGTQGQRYEWTRPCLAIGITGLSIIGIAVLGATAIYHDTTEAKDVMNAVLPLVGTWVGTILAFFFSKESFESASRSVERVTKSLSATDRLRSLPVSAIMTPLDRLYACTDPASMKLVDALSELNNRNLSTLPVLTSAGGPRGVIYTVDIIDYLFRLKKDASDDERNALTVQNLLDECGSKNPYAVVAETSTVADAQAALAAVPGSRLVFVTRNGTGSTDDPVAGILTSHDIARQAQV